MFERKKSFSHASSHSFSPQCLSVSLSLPPSFPPSLLINTNQRVGSVLRPPVLEGRNDQASCLGKNVSARKARDGNISCGDLLLHSYAFPFLILTIMDILKADL